MPVFNPTEGDDTVTPQEFENSFAKPAWNWTKLHRTLTIPIAAFVIGLIVGMSSCHAQTILATNYTQSVQPGDTVVITAAQDPHNPQPAVYNEITVRPNGQVKVISAPTVPPGPVFTVPPGATLLPWNTGNSRTVVQNCNPAGDTRVFYFIVPANATTPHSIAGTAYSSGANRMFWYTLKELPDNAAMIHAGPSTGIVANFSFNSRFGYTVIRKGQTYTLTVTSEATAPYPCTYYIDLNA